MKLENLIEYLSPDKLNELYQIEGLNKNSEAIIIYMQGSLDLGSEIFFFEIEETEELVFFKKGEINYTELFPLEYAVELVESDLDLKNKGKTNLEIAKRLLEYRIKDA
ncbi:MAG: hypothetical protein ABJA78_11875 [Ferruginibacter sp.]